jgi:hypothetical protein
VIEDIQKRVSEGAYRFTMHAFERCVERNISPQEVKSAILSGEIIEDYPEDKYGHSCLIYGTAGNGKILHVQCSLDPVWIITAYDPTLEPGQWEWDFKRRKTKS